MTNVSELVMPKLGLTMTEGRVAQWMVKPGENFNQGDVVVVIETDKIANDVEAPAAGQLVEILVEEGAVVPVGAAIAKWRLQGGQHIKTTGLDVERHVTNAPLPVRPQEITPVKLNDVSGSRIIATPLARRLAREANLDLAGMTGTGPGGRIKAGDVERALALRGSASNAPQKATSLAPSSLRAPESSVARLSFATIDVDIDALVAIQASLAKSGNAYQLRDFVALACSRILGSEQSSVRLGIELADLQQPASFLAEPGETLSSIAGKCAILGQGSGRCDNAAVGGDVVLLVAEAPIHVFAPAAPAGWHMALGIGSIRRCRGKPEGTQHELSLSLSYDAASRDHASSARFLGKVKAFLEDPLLLLAS